jgi:hypothetical protein
MRRILRAREEGKELGDTSTLEEWIYNKSYNWRYREWQKKKILISP